MLHHSAIRMTFLMVLGLSGCAGDLDQSGITTGSAPPEQPDSVRGTQVLPGQSSRVFTLAGFSSGCASTTQPDIRIDAHPAKGNVTLVAVEPTTIQYSLSGNCIGRKVAGTGVYYTPHAGATGSDTFTISAHAGLGTVATRTIAIKIAE